jgi:hypothetical protein
MLMLYISDAKRTLTPAQLAIANEWVAANPIPVSTIKLLRILFILFLLDILEIGERSG